VPHFIQMIVCILTLRNLGAGFLYARSGRTDDANIGFSFH
jgi:hypothetical protein